MAPLVLSQSRVPPDLRVGQVPFVVSASVLPPFTFPDPSGVRDHHEGVPVQGGELELDPATAALTLLLPQVVAIHDRELLLDLAPLQLRAQARAVVLEEVEVADLKASQIWGRAVVQQCPRVPPYRSSDMRR